MWRGSGAETGRRRRCLPVWPVDADTAGVPSELCPPHCAPDLPEAQETSHHSTAHTASNGASTIMLACQRAGQRDGHRRAYLQFITFVDYAKKNWRQL